MPELISGLGAGLMKLLLERITKWEPKLIVAISAIVIPVIVYLIWRESFVRILLVTWVTLGTLNVTVMGSQILRNKELENKLRSGDVLDD